MSHLLDVGVLIACGWKSHPQHRVVRRWLEAQSRFYTCPLSHLGFLRVSISPAFRATFGDASAVLEQLTRLNGARFLADTLPGTALSGLQGAAEVTDAYLVALARANSVRLATLDDGLCGKSWAAGIAVNPVKR